METQYLIPESLRVALVNYLAQKPFAEVSQVIPALQRLQKAPEPDPAKELAENDYVNA